MTWRRERRGRGVQEVLTVWMAPECTALRADRLDHTTGLSQAPAPPSLGTRRRDACTPGARYGENTAPRHVRWETIELRTSITSGDDAI